MMPTHYLPILVFIAVGLGLGLAMLGAGSLFSTHKPDAEKNSHYECGFDAFENARIPFDVRFYLLFLIWKRLSFSLGRSFCVISGGLVFPP